MEWTFDQYRAMHFALQERIQREVYRFSEREIAERNAEPYRSQEAQEVFAMLPPGPEALVRHVLRVNDPSVLTNRCRNRLTQAGREARWQHFVVALQNSSTPLLTE